MLWPPVRCGGKDRGLPPVGRFDTQLGLLLAAGLVGAALAVLAIVPALLLRLLGALMGAATVLAGTVAPAVAAVGATALLHA
jgi:hypothetical protein